MGKLEEQYKKDGFLVMEEVIPLQAIESLRTSARVIVDAFDSDQHREGWPGIPAQRGFQAAGAREGVVGSEEDR